MLFPNFWVQKPLFKGDMDFQEHVENTQPVEALDFQENPEPSNPTDFGDSVPDSDPPSVVEETASSVDASIKAKAPGCVSLPVKFTNQKWPANSRNSTEETAEAHFCSLREFRLQKKPQNNYHQFITDEPDTQVNVGKIGPSLNQRTTGNNTTVPLGLIHGFFTLPINTTLSSMAGPKYKPYKNHTFSLFPTMSLDMVRIIQARVPLNDLSSPDLDEQTKTPDPCSGIHSGPHEPPRPAEVYHPQRKVTPALFHDQFTQFMEDRMVMFRPTSSQNNVEQSLNSNHPYQQVGEVDTMHLRSWFTLNPTKYSAQRVSPLYEHTPGISVDSPLSGAPANNSTSSFLPRGVQGPCSIEPENSAMVYTPRGIPLSDAKGPSISPIQSQCMCLWWPF